MNRLDRAGWTGPGPAAPAGPDRARLNRAGPEARLLDI